MFDLVFLWIKKISSKYTSLLYGIITLKASNSFFLLSEMAILKLVGVTAVFFLSGLLPWIDNYAHLFGFIFGFLISYAIMPFVTFGIYDRKRKLILLWICLLSCIVIFVGLILLFYVTPIHDCEICKYFNCIPITKDFCSEQNIDLRETVWWKLFFGLWLVDLRSWDTWNSDFWLVDSCHSSCKPNQTCNRSP